MISEEELEEWGSPSSSSSAGEVRRLSWAEHFAFLDEHWEAGQHASIFAATDGGKTFLIRHLLPLWIRYPVLWFHNKPKPDRSLAGLPFHRVPSFPSRASRLKYEIRRRTQPDSPAWWKDPEWYLVQLPAYRWTPKGKQNRDYLRAQRIAGESIDRAYAEGSWVIVFDEVKVLAGREEPHLNLPAPMTIAWEQGRSQPLTVIAGTQSPALAPPPMYDQARHVYLGRILDTYRGERLAEIGGDSKRIRAILPQLQAREFLYVFMGRDRNEPAIAMWVVQAPGR